MMDFSTQFGYVVIDAIGAKPCPFCGQWNNVSIIHHFDNGDNPESFAVGCDATIPNVRATIGCGGVGPFKKTPQEATDAWNRRA